MAWIRNGYGGTKCTECKEFIAKGEIVFWVRPVFQDRGGVCCPKCALTGELLREHADHVQFTFARHMEDVFKLLRELQPHLMYFGSDGIIHAIDTQGMSGTFSPWSLNLMPF